MRIRLATAADAEPGSAVLRRSIVELYAADHGGDPAAIAAWTANKTPEEWRRWLDMADVALFVAVEDGAILGVGAVAARGEVMLDYVSPAARLRGVSKALLRHMEEWLRARGVREVRLESSRTAEPFYRAAGYEPADGERRMVKRLTDWLAGRHSES